MTSEKWSECPAAMRSRGSGSADEPAMQDTEELMGPGALVQEVEKVCRHDAAQAGKDDENGREEEPEENEEEPSKG